MVEPDSICESPVTSVDFYPTFLELSGVDVPTGHILDGRSIAPLLKGEGSLDDRDIFWHYPHYHHSRPAGAIRNGVWKLIEFYDTEEVELYNLDSDISEKTDLSKKIPEKADELRRRLAAWRKSVNAKMPVPNPDYDPEKAGRWGKHPGRN